MNVFDREVEGEALAAALEEEVQPLQGGPADFDPLMEWVGNKRFVLLGEATHGSHELQRARAQITRRLIEEKGFTAVAVEADWPDAYRVNRYVQGRGTDLSASEALGQFRRFPSWLWRNVEVLDFVGWLRARNEQTLHHRGQMTGFYGLDLYSLHASIDGLMRAAGEVDRSAAAQARLREACFDGFGAGEGERSRRATRGLGRLEQEVVRYLVALRERRDESLSRDGLLADDQFFHAERSGELAANAEQYFHGLLAGAVASWNLREAQMADAFEALVRHLGRKRDPVKVVVWAHNSHLGDARATEAGWSRGGCNLGQLLRERHPGQTLAVGLTTHHGRVSAATEWGGRAARLPLPPAIPGSYEALFHSVGVPRFLLNLSELGERLEALRDARPLRAVGLVYQPRSERPAHYARACLPEQFDVLLHIDQTGATEPLEPAPEWEAGEVPERIQCA